MKCNTSGDCNQSAFILFPGATDNCDPAGGMVTNITFSDPSITPPFFPIPLSTQQISIDFPVGTTTATLVVSDACGNSSTQEYTVTILDCDAPVASNCPPAIINANTSDDGTGDCFTDITWTNPSFNDNCLGGIFTLTFSDGDPAGNPSTYTLPDGLSAPGPHQTYTGTLGQNQPETYNFSKGVTIVDLKYTDAGPGGTPGPAGVGMPAPPLTVSCIITVTVTDDEAPSLISGQGVTTPINLTTNGGASCPSIATVDNVGVGPVAFGATYMVAGTGPYTAPLATDFMDNCADGALSITAITPGGDACNGTIEIDWRFTDCGGATIDQTQVFTIADDTAPVAVCPAVIADVVLDGTGSGTLPADIGDGSSTDNCGGILVETSPSATFGCGDVGPQTVVLTVTDCGLSSNTSCTFNVVDTQAPVANCGNIADVVLDGTGTGILPADAAAGGLSTDNCTANLMESSPTATFGCGDIGAQSVVLTVTDGTNTVMTNCSFNVVDTQAPVAMCPTTAPSVTIATVGGSVMLPANALAAGNSTDNCGVNLVETSPAMTYGCGDVGTQMVTLTATDGTNTSTISCAVNVISGGALVWTSALPGDQTLNATVTDCDQDVFIPIPTSSGSNCSGTIITAISAPGNINFGNLGTQWNANFPVGVTPVTITATDALGVVLTHTLTVTIIDNTPPVLSSGCPSNIVIPSAPICNSTASFNLPNATDACGVAGIDVTYSGNSILPTNLTNQASGTSISEDFAIGITTVTITVFDINGLSASCSFTVESPCTTVVNPCIDNNYVSTADIVANGTSALYKANIRTYSDAVIPNGFDIDYFGGDNVELLPGFETMPGALFLADIAPCNSLPLNGPITPESKRLLQQKIKELKESKETKEIFNDQIIEIRK